MTEQEHKELLCLDFNYIFDGITEQYVYEHGQHKAEQLAIKVRESRQVYNYLSTLQSSKNTPNALELLYFVNKLPFLMISKSESICLVAVVVAVMRFDQLQLADPAEKQIVTQYLLELIFRCEKLKFSKTNTFFTRLYDRLLYSE